MARRIRIVSGESQWDALLNDGPTADVFWEALPIEGQANIWGDEIYFRIPISAEPEADARAEVAVGEIAFWPPGSAFCIFFGPTPASTGTAPVAASPVNSLGQLEGDLDRLRAVQDRDRVRLERT